MIEDIEDFITCESCSGQLRLNNKETLNNYSMITNVNDLNIFDKVDKLITKYLVYECSNCGSKFKYTFKDIEGGIRRNITKKFLAAILDDGITNFGTHDFKYYIYCGKCDGFDGTGGCPKGIFENCKIKRFPISEL